MTTCWEWCCPQKWSSALRAGVPAGALLARWSVLSAGLTFTPVATLAAAVSLATAVAVSAAVAVSTAVTLPATVVIPSIVVVPSASAPASVPATHHRRTQWYFEVD